MLFCSVLFFGVGVKYVLGYYKRVILMVILWYVILIVFKEYLC